MTFKANRTNHDIHILHFHGCHTVDGLYGWLCANRDDRLLALGQVEPALLRTKAKLHSLKWRLWSPFKSVRLRAKADLIEMEATRFAAEKNIAGAKAELNTIERCMEALEPHRKYRHLPLPEAHEAAQYEEWKRELIFRAENCLISTGTIQPDQLATMRMHPEFAKAILPAIEQAKKALADKSPKFLERKNDLPNLLPRGTRWTQRK